MPLLKLQSSAVQPNSDLQIEFQKNAELILSNEIGKSIDFVLVIQEFDCTMSFGGDSKQPVAFFEIKNVGSLSNKVTQNLSILLCELCTKQFSIPADRIYLEFQESARTHWGWNGKTLQ
tara:strand:+ start:183 stop:539 length:357 start_codon:yes stop_codon:yes gene_type:complete